MKKLIHSKILWTIVLLLVAVAIIVPPLVVPKINEFLAEFSPIYKARIEGLTINPFRGAYAARGLQVTLKAQPEEKFINVDRIDASLAWRELFRGKIVADLLIDEADVFITDNVLAAVRKANSQSREDTEKAVKKMVPFRIERIDVRDSSVEIADFRKLPKEARWRLSDIDGRISNATPSENAPMTLATLEGELLDSAPLKVLAQMNLTKKPLAWDADIEIKDFELPKANPVLKTKVPLTFNTGKLDLYSEIKSEKGGISGYAKPFVKNADIVARGEDFADLKNYGIEVSTAAANLLLRNSKDKTMATKIDFAYNNGDFKINSAKALSEAIENSFGDEVPEGIEDEVRLSGSSQEASEEKENEKGDQK